VLEKDEQNKAAAAQTKHLVPNLGGRLFERKLFDMLQEYIRSTKRSYILHHAAALSISLPVVVMHSLPRSNFPLRKFKFIFI
jgi:hypothetical protein